jgi:dethiobiotin synthetase
LTVLGTDTEVGKTYLSCKILDQLAEAGIRVGAYKPVASGYSIDDPDSDPQKLLRATQTQFPVSLVCPQAFAAPLAPPVAARQEGREVCWEQICGGLEAWKQHADFVLVESAGGVLSPIAYDKTSVDLAMKAGYPVVLVVANRLGCVNHCLLSLEALVSRHINVAGILLNNIAPAPRDKSVETNAELIRSFTDTVIFDSPAQLVESLHLGGASD